MTESISRLRTRSAWLAVACLLVAGVFAVLPAVELTCDGDVTDGHGYGHLHTPPAVLSERLTLPIAAPRMLWPAVATPGCLAAEARTVFVPPRS